MNRVGTAKGRDDLLGFWQKVAAARETPHPADDGWLSRYLHAFKMNRPPEPWFGDLQTARVFFLTLNPGHFPPDDDHPTPAWTEFIWKMIAGAIPSSEEFWSVASDPAKQWVRRTYGDFSAIDHCLAICNLRLVAYPSQDRLAFARLPPLVLPSARLMFDFVHQTLVPEARSGKTALLVMRSPAEWGFGEVREDSQDKGLFISKPVRNVSISPNSRVGDLVREFISRR